MLKLSNRMVETMIEARQQRFATDYLGAAAHDFPELWVDHDDERVRQLLLEQCADARRHGIDSARGVYLLLTLRLMLGRDFPGGDEDAWAREILGREGLDEHDKLDAIEALCWGAAT